MVYMCDHPRDTYPGSRTPWRSSRRRRRRGGGPRLSRPSGRLLSRWYLRVRTQHTVGSDGYASGSTQLEWPCNGRAVSHRLAGWVVIGRFFLPRLEDAEERVRTDGAAVTARLGCWWLAALPSSPWIDEALSSWLSCSWLTSPDSCALLDAAHRPVSYP